MLLLNRLLDDLHLKAGIKGLEVHALNKPSV